MLPIELFSESSPDPPTPYRILADHSNTMADQLSHYRCHYFLHHPRPITHKLSIFITQLTMSEHSFEEHLANEDDFELRSRAKKRRVAVGIAWDRS